MNFLNVLTKNSKSEIEGYNNNVPIAGQYWSVVRIARIPFVRFSMDEDNNWEFDVHVFTPNYFLKWKYLSKSFGKVHTLLSTVYSLY